MKGFIMAKKEPAAVPTLAAQLVSPVAETLDAVVLAGIVAAYEAQEAEDKSASNTAHVLRNMLVSIRYGAPKQVILAKQQVELTFATKAALGAKNKTAITQSAIIVCGIPAVTTGKNKSAAIAGLGAVAFAESLTGDCLVSADALRQHIRELWAKTTGKVETRGASTPVAKTTEPTKIVEPAAAVEPTSSKACISLILRSLKMLESFNLKMKDSEKFVLSSAVDTLESLEARAA
jgi:hypothetical protein